MLASVKFFHNFSTLPNQSLRPLQGPIKKAATGFYKADMNRTDVKDEPEALAEMHTSSYPIALSHV
jgi:hypothetical protein